MTVVPTAAVQRGAPGTFVYVIKPDQTVGVQTVKLGPVDGDKVAVLSGLSPGDKVVVDGADRLRPGQPVTVAAAHQKQASGQTSGQSPAQPAGSGTGQPGNDDKHKSRQQ